METKERNLSYYRRKKLNLAKPTRLIIIAKSISLSFILQFVANCTGLTIKELKSDSRWQPLADARAIFYILALKNSYKLVDIAAYLGKNHSTVLKVVKYKTLIERIDAIENFLDKCETNIQRY